MGAILCVVSNLMYLGEKFTTCIAVAGVATCLVFTLIMMLGLGVGLGYNYCFVDIKTKHKYVPGHYRYQVIDDNPERWRYPWRYPEYDDRRPRVGDGSDEENIAREWNTGVLKNDTNNETLNDAAKNVNGPSNSTTIADVNSAVGEIDNSNDQVSVEGVTKKNVNEEPKTLRTVLKIDGLDLIALINKLRAENRNYTVELLAT